MNYMILQCPNSKYGQNLWTPYSAAYESVALVGREQDLRAVHAVSPAANVWRRLLAAAFYHETKP